LSAIIVVSATVPVLELELELELEVADVGGLVTVAVGETVMANPQTRMSTPPARPR
jgi:hypothetical protein